MRFYEKMDDENYLEDFFAMETWLNDNIRLWVRSSASSSSTCSKRTC